MAERRGISFLGNIIDSFLKKDVTDYPPFQVVEIKPEAYVHYRPYQREDSLILYGVPDRDPPLYEVVLHKDLIRSSNYAFSICRCKTLQEAQPYFNALQDKLPLLAKLCPNNINVATIQELFDMTRDDPTLNIAHICAHFSLMSAFADQQVQDCVNKLSEKTGRSPLQVAIKTGRLPVVQTVLSLNPNLELVDNDGNNCLHTASLTSRDIIEAICTCEAAGSSIPNLINRKNKDDFSPLYLACLNDRPDCVKELLRRGADVNGASVEERLPKDSSFEYKPEVMDQLETKDMKHGGTPLHWCKSPACMEALIEMGCQIDAKNFQGETALHMNVQRSKLGLVVTLLSHGANVNATGPNGNTPLHIAAKAGDISIVKALVVFGADLDIRNTGNETARHVVATSKRTNELDTILYILHTVGARRCQPSRMTCNDGCSSSSSSHFNGIPPESSPFHRSVSFYDTLFSKAIVHQTVQRKKRVALSKTPPSASNSSTFVEGDIGLSNETPLPEEPHQGARGRVLCLDGGGVRGLILIQMLWVIEEFIKRPVLDCFDIVSGTSTGGILALLLALGHKTGECRELYFRFKDKVFVGSRPYDSEPLEKFLRKTFGEETRMSDIKRPRVMITATVADRFPADMHLFRNYPSPKDILAEHIPIQDMMADIFSEPFPKPDQELIWHAARSSGAAPTYFRPLGRFLDGGLISNNPTLDAMVEIHQLNSAYSQTNQKEKIIRPEVIVSLGTGAIPVKHVPMIDVFRPDSLFGVAKMAFMASSLGQLLVDQASQADGQVVERARSWCDSINVPYFRLNPPISEDIHLDETDNEKLVNMLWETTAYMLGRRKEVEDLLTLLLT